MAGIYIHIPFCKQACHYCDFHFSTSLRLKDRMIQGLIQEIKLRSDYLPTSEISSVYLGGGTPSLLEPADLDQLFTAITQHFTFAPNAEITLEANPDDLNPGYLRELKQSPVNRLSIGVQSFHDDELAWMNRAHRASMALDAIRHAQDAGFTNLTIDLIFGLPISNRSKWEQNMEQFLELDIPHLSAYGLTVEPRTALDYQIKHQQTAPISDEVQGDQFMQTMDVLTQAGYEHYELSNYARPGNYAQHNTSYWFGEPYLGIGPSAHSYDQTARQWNVRHNRKYLEGVESRNLLVEREILSQDEHFNDWILTRLRTKWGLSLDELRNRFGEAPVQLLVDEAKPLLEEGMILIDGKTLLLSRFGKLMADKVSAVLFRV